MGTHCPATALFTTLRHLELPEQAHESFCPNSSDTPLFHFIVLLPGKQRRYQCSSIPIKVIVLLYVCPGGPPVDDKLDFYL